MFALVPVDDFVYKLLLLLHIAAVVAAFAPGFVLPGVRRKVAALGGDADRAVADAAATGDLRVHGPALVLAGLFGFGLVASSDEVFEFSQSWISVAMLLWFLMLGVVFGLLVPAERRLARGDGSARKLVAMAGGILHLLFLVMVIDMIWKPGFY